MTHKEKMKARRIRQLARLPGFSPVPNRGIDARIQFATAVLIADGKEPNVAERLAIQQVRAGLPQGRAFMRTRPYGGRSKYPASYYSQREAA